MRRLVALAAAAVFADAVFYAALAPLLPDYTDGLGLSHAGAGVLAASYGAGTLLGALPAAWVASRTGARTAVVVGLLLLSAGSLGFAFADSAVLLDVTRFVQGVGGSSAWVGAFLWIIDAGPRERQGELLGSVIAIAIAGAVLGPALGAVAASAGSELVFAGAGALSALLATCAWRMPAPVRLAPPSDLVRRGRQPRIGLGVWLIALGALFAGLLGVLAPLRLDSLGVGATTIGVTFLLAAAGEATTSSLGGRLADRRGRVVPVRLALACGAAATFLLAWPAAAWELAMLVVLASMGFGLLWAPAMALLTDRADEVRLGHGFVLALVGMAFAAGQMVGAGVGGSVAEAAGETLPYAVVACLCLATLAGIGLQQRVAPRVVYR
jgi:MFS family permease